MKKTIGLSILSAIGIALIIWVTSLLMSFSFSEWSFLIGLGLSVIIFFFNSSGGALSKVATFEASEGIGKIQKDDELRANKGIVFYGSIIFTVISFAIMLVTYF